MKNIKRSLVINILIIMISAFLFKSVSYSAKTDPTKDNKDLLIQTGNMQVILNIPNEKYEFSDTLKESVSDAVGIKQDGYDFSIKNTGNIPIEYYEIRLVDQENKVSTLPHKYIRFNITSDGKDNDTIKNLGDNDSIIYSGYNLDVGKSVSFNLKMWIQDNEINALGKELYGAIEVTLYQKYDVYKNYVLYDGNGGINVPIRTSIYNPITSDIPEREGYNFLGWETKNGLIKYYSGDTYKENSGTTLYAIWEKA